jgi:glutamine synthetase
MCEILTNAIMVIEKPKTKEEVLSLANEAVVKFVKMQFTDVNGFIKAVTIPIQKLGNAIDDNVWFDGSSVEGFTRIAESDMFLKPDLATFAIVPWTIGTDTPSARIICDVYMPNGEPFKGDPRYILKKQIKRAEDLGYTYYVGPELEFFIFKKENGDFSPLPFDNAGYFDQTMDLAGDIRGQMSLMLQKFGLDVEALHHEVAPGQHEINFKYEDALTQADNVCTFKYVVKSIARRYDLHATFMAKPVAGINGSGMHCNQSLFKDGENVFYDSEQEKGLSDIARNFIAGQLDHVKAMTAVLNPTVNSYKRLVAGYEAPVYIAWGQENRSTLVRIPRISKGSPKSTRCELRSPDPTCNPYLAFAVMIAAGLDGMERELTPPEPVNENVFELSNDDAIGKGVDILPNNLNHALSYLQEDEVLKKALGAHTLEMYMKAKKADWLKYKAQVTTWEIEQYLELY